MSLREDIHLAQTSAIKERNADLTSVLRILWSAVRNEEIDKRRDLTDEEVIAIVSRQVKQLEDANTDFEKGGRVDLVDKNKQEISILRTYLPAQLSDEELQSIIKTIVAAQGPIDSAQSGKLIGVVMKEVKGKADGNRVRAMMAELLQS